MQTTIIVLIVINIVIRRRENNLITVGESDTFGLKLRAEAQRRRKKSSRRLAQNKSGLIQFRLI